MALKMDFEEVKGFGTNIKAKSEEVTNLQNFLNQVVNEQLPGIWQGQGYEGFQQRVREMAPSFEAMRQLITDIGDGVIKNAEAYQEFDTTVGSKNRNQILNTKESEQAIGLAKK